MALSVKPNFFPELWMTTGCRGAALQREESRLGEESLEDGSEEREYGERGLASGDAPNTSGRTTDDHQPERMLSYYHSDFGSVVLSAPAVGETNVILPPAQQ